MKKTNDDFWIHVLKEIKKQVSRQVFDTWFIQTNQESLGDDYVVIEVPSELYQQLFQEKYANQITKIVEDLAQKRMEIIYKVAQIKREDHGPLFEISSDSEFRKHDEDYNVPQKEDQALKDLQPNYTFSRFVVGPSNQFVHAAAQAVACNPSKSYNPLYIHGGVGLGKTHLMHAIAHAVRDQLPKTNILYVQSEHFTNDVITHIRFDKMPEFRKKYRNVDILLIDDIQFIAGKESTITEFFHTFNTLYNARKQIVISSDQPPRKISNLEERIRSRFEWGLIADIQPPNLETKVAILQKKAEELDFELPSDIAIFMASKITSNVRELEGALMNLTARVSLTGAKVDMDAAWEAVKQYISEEDKVITIAMVQKQVAQFYDIKTSSLRAKDRSQEITNPRQIAMYLCREITSQSLAEIGKRFGGRNHTTVIHSCKKVESNIQKNSEVRSQIKLLKGMLQA